MKHHEHRPQLKFDLKMPFNTQAQLKGWGHVLMTKYGKSGKTGLSSFLFRIIQF
jgi:hypothetical protein